MNAYNIRIIILVVMFSLLIYKIKKINKKITIKISFFVFLLSYVLYQFLSLIPYEKPFLSFNKLESAFNYSYPNCSIVLKIEKPDYAFILYKKDKSKEQFNIASFTKNEKNNWNFSSPFLNFEKIESYNGNLISSKTIKKYDVKFIFLIINKMNLGTSNQKYYPIDSVNSKFIDISSDNDIYYQKYYAIVENIPDNYYIVLNNKRISI